MSGEKIYIVEDEAIVALDLRTQLEGLGYEVCGQATRGEQAVEEIPALLPDLVLMDVRLAGKMTGLDVAEQLLGAFHIPIVFLSAYSEQPLLARAARTNSIAYLLKPFHPHILEAHIRMALRHSQLEQSLRKSVWRLQESEGRFRKVFESSPDALLICNAAGQIQSANQQACALLGYPREELCALGVEQLLPEAERAAHRGHRGRYHRDPRTRQMGSAARTVEARRKDGSTFPVDIVLSALHTEGTINVMASIRDITSRLEAEELKRSLERQLRQAQKMEALGTLAGGVAHDFNNLLMAISAHTRLAMMDSDEGAAVQESLEAISEATGRAIELVRGLLNFSRSHAPRRTVTPLRPLMEEVTALLRATIPAGIQLQLDVEEGTPQVLADANQLHQVLMNLGTNAWHAMEGGGGLLRLQARGVELGEAAETAPAVPAGSYAVIEVIDQGHGMAPETLERVFEPFFTTKEVDRGTGLGLSVVHGIVREHGGGIRIRSAPGEGSTFSIFLPAADAAAASNPEPPRPLQVGEGSVLYVDDDPGVGVAVTRLLQRLGYQASLACGGEEALELLREHPGRFSAILTDYNMPGMSGLELAEVINTLQPGIPLILVSGHATWSQADLERAGIYQVLEKPFELEQLAELLLSIPGLSAGA
jgi:two-component system cell cycle sensor histidine kinase/response regulator CckA